MRKNIERVLRHLGLADAVYITSEAQDRVYGWAADGRLIKHVVLHEWITDVKESTEYFHGSAITFREPASPSLQVVIHLVQGGRGPYPYFVELDLDFYAPSWRRPWTLLLHGWEVLRNAITRKKTDPVKMARALDKRFGGPDA